MRTLRFFVFAFALAALSFGVTACDDKGDDAPGINEADLIGTWQIVHRTGSVKYADHPDLNREWDDDVTATGGYFVLAADHTFGGVSNDTETGEEEIGAGKWSLSGRTLRMTVPENTEDAIYIDKATIRSLDKNVLILEFSEKYTDEENGSYRLTDVWTTRKIIID